MGGAKLKSSAQGFTLLELLVAISIFAMMSALAYGSLFNVLQGNETITKQEAQLKKLQRSMMFIERDIRQMILRSKSTGYGAADPALSVGQGTDDGTIEFTRAGNSNPNDAVRSSLQRVKYAVQDKKLVRMTWNLVDNISAEPISMILLEDVESLVFKFLNNKNTWESTWGSATEIPKVIELKLKHKHWGEITRLFSIR